MTAPVTPAPPVPVVAGRPIPKAPDITAPVVHERSAKKCTAGENEAIVNAVTEGKCDHVSKTFGGSNTPNALIKNMQSIGST